MCSQPIINQLFGFRDLGKPVTLNVQFLQIFSADILYKHMFLRKLNNYYWKIRIFAKKNMNSLIP